MMLNDEGDNEVALRAAPGASPPTVSGYAIVDWEARKSDSNRDVATSIGQIGQVTNIMRCAQNSKRQRMLRSCSQCGPGLLFASQVCVLVMVAVQALAVSAQI